MLSRFTWWFTGRLAKFVVEDIEDDSSSAVGMPAIAWIVAATSAYTGFSAVNPLFAAVAIAVAMSSGFLALVFTAGSVYWAKPEWFNPFTPGVVG